MTDQENPDNGVGSSGSSDRKDERSNNPTKSEIGTSRESQEIESEGTETEVLRRSRRQGEPPNRLNYPQLGNPFCLVIQSLFSSLSTSVTTSLENSNLLRKYSPVENI